MYSPMHCADTSLGDGRCQGTPCDPADLKRVLAKKAHPLNPDLLMHIK